MKDCHNGKVIERSFYHLKPTTENHESKKRDMTFKNKDTSVWSNTITNENRKVPTSNIHNHEPNEPRRSHRSRRMVQRYGMDTLNN